MKTEGYRLKEKRVSTPEFSSTNRIEKKLISVT